MVNNDVIYVVALEFGIIKGKFLREIDNGKQEVLLDCPNGKTRKMLVLTHQLYFTEEDAKMKFYSLQHHLERKKLSKTLEDNECFLPKPLAELDGVYASGNPLRFGEPNISFVLQTNTATTEDNPAKIIQIIGAIWEDIEMLKHILYVISYGNDYAKKLIGKYIVIELRSLFACLQRLSVIDTEYGDGLYHEFVEEVTRLEDEFKIGAMPASDPVVRNKISAHRDLNLDLLTTIELWEKITRYNIYEYIKIFGEHIDNLLTRYPNEARLYFSLRKEPFRTITAVNHPNNAYKPFDEPLIKKNKKELEDEKE